MPPTLCVILYGGQEHKNSFEHQGQQQLTVEQVSFFPLFNIFYKF